MSAEFVLTLAQQAKSSGGDKYKVSQVPAPSKLEKESFIYVPQHYSRTSGGGKASVALNMIISTSDGVAAAEMITEPNVGFELVKEGKTGDDRYKSLDDAAWKGDIYVGHNFRNSSRKIYVRIK